MADQAFHKTDAAKATPPVADGMDVCPMCRLVERADASGDVEGYVDQITRELHDRIEQQRDLMKHLLLSGRAGRAGLASCPLTSCPRLEALRGVLKETIETLEATRSAFKSKRLEVMRKKLTQMLIES